MRDARVRVFGQGVASAIVKTRDRHPNVALLLARLIDEYRLDEIVVQADAAKFIRGLKALPKSEGSLVLQTLLLAAILDGRTPRRERDLIQQAFAATGRSLQEAVLKKLKLDFLSGRRCHCVHCCIAASCCYPVIAAAARLRGQRPGSLWR